MTDQAAKLAKELRRQIDPARVLDSSEDRVLYSYDATTGQKASTTSRTTSGWDFPARPGPF